jgi:hypothetical protein
MAEPIKVEPSVIVEAGDTSITSFQLKIDTERLDEDVSVLVICCCLIDPQEWEIRIDPACDMDNGLTLRELQVITASVTRFIHQVSGMVFEINNYQERIHVAKDTPEFCQ